jgi:hypothetical protein
MLADANGSVPMRSIIHYAGLALGGHLVQGPLPEPADASEQEATVAAAACSAPCAPAIWQLSPSRLLERSQSRGADRADLGKDFITEIVPVEVFLKPHERHVDSDHDDQAQGPGQHPRRHAQCSTLSKALGHTSGDDCRDQACACGDGSTVFDAREHP